MAKGSILKTKTSGGKNVGIEMRGKTGLGLDYRDYTVYRKKGGDYVIVDKGYRRTKQEMKSWTKVGKNTKLAKGLSRMMVHDNIGEKYRFTKASKSVAETEFLKPATESYLGTYRSGWIDIRTGQFIASSPVHKFRNEKSKGDLQYEFASVDNGRAFIMLEGYGLEEWYLQLSGADKALLNQHFAQFDWKDFYGVYFASSPPEKNGKVDEKAELDGFQRLVAMTEEVLGNSYRNFLARGLGKSAVEMFL